LSWCHPKITAVIAITETIHDDAIMAVVLSLILGVLSLRNKKGRRGVFRVALTGVV